MDAERKPTTTYVLMDFENVNAKSLEPLLETDYQVKVFIGHLQTRFSAEFVQLLLRFGSRVELIRVDGIGPNALDFHIAYYVGRLTCEAPGSALQIISNDAGYDPLIRHLKRQGMSCKRVRAIPTPRKAIKASATTPLPPFNEQLDRVRANLSKRPAGRPRTMKTLRTTINALFQKRLTPAGVDELVAALTSSGIVSDVGGKAEYH